MKNTTFKNTVGTKNTFVIILKYSTLFALLYIIVLSVYFPVKQVYFFNQKYNDSLLFKGEEKIFILDDSIAEHKINESFLQSRISMSQSDSIAFSVNLKDSLLFLEIKGVIVHEAKISKIAKSNFFSRVENEALIKYLKEPFKVENKIATIEKEPIIFKQAPKDTLEAAAQVFKPDTITNEIVCITMLFDKNLILEISQSEEKTHINNLLFLIKKRSWNLVQVIKNSIKYKEPYYTPKIIIELPKKDVKSIYRALPYKPQMALNI